MGGVMSQTLRINAGRFACSVAASVGFLLTGPSTAFSHHPSGVSSSGTSGPILTIPGTTLNQGAINAWAAFEYISFDELSDAVLEEAAANHEHVHSLASLESPMAGLSYGMTNRLMVSLQLPYVIRTGIREGAHHHAPAPAEHHDEAGAEGGEHHEAGAEGGEHHEAGGEHQEMVMTGVVDRGDSEGIGDLSILGQYRFLGQSSGPQASLLFGIKTPTGATDERDDEGELFETEFQPGSGSWDGLFGLAVTQGMGRWSLDSNVLYAAATEGAEQTDLGDRFHYNAAISYRLIGAGNAVETAHEHRHGGGHQHEHEANGKGGFAVDAALEINGEWQAKETISGETDPNSGGNVVYLSPGVRLTSNAWSGFVSVGLPIVNDLNGEQSEAEYHLIGGASVSF